MWRPRDRERYTGSYDPEHEMPNPDRGPGDRWQSDAYRNGARDTRFAYRWNPDRFEDRFEGRHDVDREYQTRWDRDARDRERGGYDRSFGRGGGYERDFGGGGGYGRDFGGRSAGGYDRGYGSDFDRGPGRSFRPDEDYERDRYMTGPHFDRDRNYGSDRGWDYGRDYVSRGGRSPYESDFARSDRDFDDRPWRRR